MELMFKNVTCLFAHVQNTPTLTNVQGWLETNFWQFSTALNTARIQAGLGSGNFFYSRHFLNKKHAELLVVLIVKDNTARIQAFCRGQWDLPNSKTIGYDLPGYSIMLV